jgi:prepilin-type processing-associated H-X9-DG protein
MKWESSIDPTIFCVFETIAAIVDRALGTLSASIFSLRFAMTQAPASGKNPMLEEFYFFNTTDCANTIHFRHAGNAIIAFADGSQREVSGNRASFNSRLPSACVGRLPATMILP